MTEDDYALYMLTQSPLFKALEDHMRVKLEEDRTKLSYTIATLEHQADHNLTVGRIQAFAYIIDLPADMAAKKNAAEERDN